MEPLAPLSSQPVWQAGEPISINVDYDVPAFGPEDKAVDAQMLSDVHSIFAPLAPIRSHESPADGTSHPIWSEHHESSSFLATRVLPVDSERIKKSLYLTQSLKSPPQASVNVIMHEDVQAMKDALKYEGMVDETQLLHNEFAKGLAAMSNGVA